LLYAALATPGREPKQEEKRVRELSEYLIKHIVVDFAGEVDVDIINELLIKDGSPVAHDLRARLLADGGLDDFLIVLADCLREHVQTRVQEDAVTEQIQMYVTA
jgi:signal transduction histidine kinase